MSENIRQLMANLKAALIELYGEQLRGIYLFGSYARDSADTNSDLDVMIVLSNYESYSEEITRTGEIISRLSLEYDLTISRIFINEHSWNTDNTPLLRNVRAEAISL